LVYEIADDGAFAGAGRTVKNEIGDFSYRDEILQLFENIFVFGVHMNNRELCEFLYYLVDKTLVYLRDRFRVFLPTTFLLGRRVRLLRFRRVFLPP
jgi:hypothetical protein